MVKQNQTIQLYAVLSAEGYAEELVDEMVVGVAARVWTATFEKRDMPEDKVKHLQSQLHSVLHWAIHIGQSAWRLQQMAASNHNPEEWPTHWEAIVNELFQRPFIMMDAGNSILDLLNSSDLQRQLWLSTAGQRKRLDQYAVFTHIRLASLQNQADHNTVLTNMTSPSTFKEVMYQLCTKSKLYLEFLEWLVCSREKNKTKISDCMANLCTLALGMSGDALRLIWPI